MITLYNKGDERTMNEEINDLFPENAKKNAKRRELIGRLKDIEDDEYEYDYSNTSTSNFLPSSLLKESKRDKKKDKKADKENDASDGYSSDEWLNVLMNMKGGKPRGGSRGKDLFNVGEGKKKKNKKKKDEKELTDFNKEFATEIALFQNLLKDQNNFTSALQSEYDSMKSTKSSARGVTKNMTDLIENINGARQLAMQLVEKNVNVKKLIAELSMKEKKEFGTGLGEGGNMSEFASSMLKKMVDQRSTLLGTGETGEIVDFSDSEEDLFNALSESLGQSDREEESDKYLKYENLNVTVYAVVNSSDINDYEYIAKDENGNVIDDYPLPSRTKIGVNRSTDIATDDYGKKYNIIWK